MPSMPDSFGGLNVAVVGLGKSNRALSRYLLREGAALTCFDRKTESELGEAYLELHSMGASFSLGKNYLAPLPSSKYRWLFLTPGMKKNLPEITAAKQGGAEISGEIALFMDRCRGKICGITGSAGKTTTSTLTGLMLKESLPGAQVYVGGNIGSVLIGQVDAIPKEALVVLELSSFQLELMHKSPSVAALLNLRPNHLDVHDSFEDYVEAKQRIFQSQNPGDWCFLNADDPTTAGFETICPGNVGRFSVESSPGRKTGNGTYAWLEKEDLKVRILDPGSGGPGQTAGALAETVTVASLRDFLVPGKHNVSNALAASLMSLLLGGNAAGIRKAIRSFPGVEHRIEFVREVRGVKYYNDSIATSPDRTEAFMEAVPGPLALILGGYDKGLPFDGLGGKIAERSDVTVITLGKTASLIEDAIKKAAEIKEAETRVHEIPRIIRVSGLEEAVEAAASVAGPGWSVALSPACASYDMFANFEVRGRVFKQIVGKLR